MNQKQCFIDEDEGCTNPKRQFCSRLRLAGDKDDDGDEHNNHEYDTQNCPPLAFTDVVNQKFLHQPKNDGRHTWKYIKQQLWIIFWTASATRPEILIHQT